jgi:c-di-GMP-binding flagellar brake protein YcgR
MEGAMADHSWTHERRKWVRINAHCPCTIARFDDEENPIDQSPSTTFDLSSEGVGVDTRFPVQSGETLNITMALGDQVVSFRGEVVHVNQSGGHRYRSGISITDIGKMDRISLARFIYYFNPSKKPSEAE